MLTETLRKNFDQRLKAERRIISLINNANINSAQLTGLSNTAIGEWYKGALSRNLDSIISILGKISLRVRLEHNVSNELFLGEEFDRLDSFDDLFDDLKKALHSS